MNVRESVKSKLGIENLEDYVYDQYSLGVKDAEIYVDGIFEDFKLKIQEESNREFLFKELISVLVVLKKSIFNQQFNNDIEYFEIFNFSNNNDKYNIQTISGKLDDVVNFSKFILDYYDFRSLSYLTYFSKIKNVREKSKEFNIALLYLKKSNFIFDKLNELNITEKFDWNFYSFEKGIVEVLNLYYCKQIEFESNKNYEISLLKSNNERELSTILKSNKELENKILNLENKNEYVNEYYNKYYFNNQILIQDTYFGDNLPFLLNLYNFFKKNNLYHHGWSYFYSCMVITNNEMVPLVSFKKNNFVGYLFFKLKDFLIMHYQDVYFEFFQFKFLINGKPILKSIKRNYVKKNFDIELNPELKKIDDFFEKQSQVYNKI